MKKTIAVDFDGTICERKYPDIGDPNTELKSDSRKVSADVYIDDRSALFKYGERLEV